MRPIDADAILNVYVGNILTAQTDYAEGIRDVLHDIKNAPTIPQWIPCSERLPKKGEIVLVWMENRCEFGRISDERFDSDGIGWEWLQESGADYWADYWGEKIVAWMPLPQPYKGDSDEQVHRCR